MNPKVLGIFGGLGAAGTGGVYLAVTNSSGPKGKLASELIKSESFVKLLTENSEDNTKWNEAWKRYRDVHKISSTTSTYKEKDIWGLSSWAEKKGQDSAFEEFKRECEGKAKLRVDPLSQEYQDFKNYCARPKTVSELIGEDSEVSLLSKEGSGDDTHWGTAWEGYRKAHLEAGQTNQYKTQDTWQIQDWSSSKGSTSVTSHYKDKCVSQANLDIDVSKGLSDSNFINVKNWCTKAAT